MNNIWEYLRIVSYSMVIITSLISLAYKKHHVFLLIGDIIFSIFTIATLIHIVYFNTDRAIANNVFITPAVIIWAIFHYANLLKLNGKHRE